MLNISKSKDLTKHDCVSVYLKNCATAKIVLPGKVVSVETDNFTVTVKTDKTDAAFDTNDVVAVVFGNHTSTSANV